MKYLVFLLLIVLYHQVKFWYSNERDFMSYCQRKPDFVGFPLFYTTMVFYLLVVIGIILVGGHITGLLFGIQ